MLSTALYSDMTPSSRIFWGNSRVSIFFENYLLIGAGGTLLITEVNSAGEFNVLSSFYTPTGIVDVIKKEELIYILDYFKGVYVYDLSDITAPTLLAHLDLERRSNDLHLLGEFLYASHNDAGISVIDISSPSALNITNRSPVSSNEITSHNGYLYIRYRNNYSESEILIAEPVTLDSLATFPVGAGGFDNLTLKLQFSGDYGLLVENYWWGDRWGTVTVLDMTNPLDPQRRGMMELPSIVASFVMDTTKAIINVDKDLYILDLSDGATPVITETYNSILTVGGAEYLLDSDSVIIAGYDYGSGLDVLSMDPGAQLEQQNFFDISCNLGSVVSNDTLLFAGRFEGNGIYVVDISNPENPIETQYYTENIGSVRELLISDGLLYATDGQGIKIFSIEDGQIEQLSRVDGIGSGWALDKDGTLLAKGSHYGDLHLLDVSNPELPAPISSIYIDGNVNEVYLRNSYLFYCGYPVRPAIYDVSDPQNPELIFDGEEIGYFDGTIYPNDDGSILYVAQNQSLVAYDVSNIGALDTIASLQIIAPFRILEINQKNDLLFLAGFFSGESYESIIYVFDVLDPANPSVLDSFYTASWVNDLSFDSNHLIVSDNLDGVYLFDLSLFEPNQIKPFQTGESNKPSSLEFTTFPSPFNRRLSIVVKNATSDVVDLRIYSITGRLILSKHFGSIPYPNYTISLAAQRLGGGEMASGVYIVQLKSVNLESSKKVVLIK